MFNFKEETSVTADTETFTLTETESDFKITATKDGVMMSGTSPMFVRHSQLEGLGQAIGRAVRWHQGRAAAERSRKLAVNSDVDAAEAMGKF